MVAGTLIASLAVFVGALQDIQSVRLSGELRFAAVTSMELGRAVVTALAVLILVLAGAGLVPFYAVYIAGTIAAVAIGATALRGERRMTPLFTRADWRPLLADAAVYAAATAVYVVYFRVILLITSVEANPVQTGYFATGFRVTEFLVAIPGVLAATVLPVLSHAASHDRERLERGAADILRLALIAGIGAALALALAAPTVMRILTGHESSPAAPVLRIQACAVALTFLAFGTGTTLLALRRHRALLVANLVTLGCAALLAVVLVDAHGARGAAVATVIGEAVLVLAQGAGLLRALRPRGVVRAAAVSLLSAAAGVLLFALLPLPNLASAALAVALYGAIVVALGQLPPKLWALRRLRTE
jgi:O-antigen/teichoic acid export membrane protein